MQLSRQGLIALKSSAAHAALGELLAGGTVQATVLKADWRRTAKLLGAVRPPMLEHVLPKTAPDSHGDSAQLLQLRRTPEHQRAGFLTERLQSELQQILGLEQFPDPDNHVRVCFATYWDREGVLEAEFADSSEGLVFGYGGGKWASERLVRQARDRGLPAVIYRPGALFGDSANGYWSPRDFATQVIAFSLMTKTLSDAGRVIDAVPVDFVAQFIARCATSDIPPDGDFHLVHPIPVTVFEWSKMLVHRNVHMQCIPREEWFNRFLGPHSRQGSLWHDLFELRGSGLTLPISECLRRLPTFDTRNMQQAMEDQGLRVPDYLQMINDGWLDVLLQ